MSDDEAPDWGGTEDGLAEHEQVAERIRGAVADILADTAWAPPGGLLTDCVVIMGWYKADGGYVASHLRSGSPWATIGLVEDQLERMTIVRGIENTPVDDED